MIVLAAAACATPPAPTSGRAASSQPALAAGNSRAHQLGRSIVAHSGFEGLHEIGQLDFHFVFKVDGKPVADRYHRWDLQNGRDRIAWTDKAGSKHEAWLDVASRRAVGTRDGQLVTAPAELDALSEKAYALYINDTYWLMMPLKLFDPGTKLEIEEPETIDGTPFKVLRLSFSDVGLTPGDVYRLYIDEGEFRIHRWQMLLQGKADKPRDATWEDYRPVGSLLLSHRHRFEGTNNELVMEGTLAHRFVRQDVFVPPTAAPATK